MVVEASGTQTAIVGTEHTLADLLTSKTFVVFVDLSNMQAGDTVELRIYTKVLSTSGLNSAYFQSYSDAQTDATGGKIAIAVPLPSDQEYKATLKQTVGTGRNFDWKVISL